MNKVEALQLARDAFKSSTTYVDANYRKQWEDALRMFQSKHPADSKYNSEAYKYRSRLFRPKTRSVIRKNEAAMAAAFFSNMDTVNVSAANDKDPKQVLASKLYKELLQHRLTKSIPWFLTLIGAGQDAMTVGVVCSYQHWVYREKVTKTKQYMLDEATGAPIMGIEGGPLAVDGQSVEVLEDKPVIDLIPVENLRIDKGANWTDPVNSSPYVIHMIPMYVGDLKGMGHGNPKTGEKGWDIPEDGKIQAATKNSYDSTRQVREENREDSKETQGASVGDFEVAWVHKNIVRRDGEDWCFYTLGIEHALTDPVPLATLEPSGKRPYVMGCTIVETHKIYPSGFPELGKEVQKEINENVNSRQDNVKLVMNKRYIVKRGSQTDIKSLVRNVAASVTLANNPTEDVKTLEFHDVTSSAYQEQDRLNVDYDELTGNFSQSSVMTNRKLNETVGGMAMMGHGANQLTEYTIRTFTETWVEPVLRQLVELEKHYETDEVILALIGEKIEAEVTDDLFDVDVQLNVNVGIGATDPMMRVNRLLAAARSIADISQMQVSGLKLAEVSREVFGAIGYRDGGRFWEEGEDPRMAQLMQGMQQLQAELAQAQQALSDKSEQTKIQSAKTMSDIEQRAKKLLSEIDLIQAQTLETLSKAGIPASQALLALSVEPSLQ